MAADGDNAIDRRRALLRQSVYPHLSTLRALIVRVRLMNPGIARNVGLLQWHWCKFDRTGTPPLQSNGSDTFSYAR